MKSDILTRTLARMTRVSHAAARDQVDEVVHKILKTLQKGKPVKLPGLGKLIPKIRTKAP
jgi:nucleoid DNA-binding protein